MFVRIVNNLTQPSDMKKRFARFPELAAELSDLFIYLFVYLFIYLFKSLFTVGVQK